MICARSVLRSSKALYSRGLGTTCVDSGKRQIDGDDHRGLFGTFRDDLEQELGAHFGQRDIADFIKRNEIVAGPTGQRASELQLMLGLDQFIDQRGGGGEAHPVLLPAGRRRPGQ